MARTLKEKQEEAQERQEAYEQMTLHQKLHHATEQHKKRCSSGAPVSKQMLKLRKEIEAKESQMSKIGPERPHESEAATETHKEKVSKRYQKRRKRR